MRELIRSIVEAGGMVTFPYKRKHDDHMGEARITIVNTDILGPDSPRFLMWWPCGFDRFDTLDKALDAYMHIVFHPKNLALAYEGIRRRKLTGKHLDDLTKQELIHLVKLYQRDYFKSDYPFAETNHDPGNHSAEGGKKPPPATQPSALPDSQ